MRLRPGLILFWLLVAAGPASAVPAGVGSPPAEGRSVLHEADTFPQCQEIRRCGRDRRGRYRCGPMIRCQECRYVRRCGGPLGCRWEEDCRWGPYKPPLRTN